LLKDKKIVIIGLMIIAAVLGGIGQLLFKYAFIDKMFGLTIFAGLAIYAVSTAIYFYVLSRTHLSWANSLSGISYILAVVLAATILGEHVTLLRWAGVLVIGVGVLLVGLS
jgi:uncharacterized membrane protein